MLAFKANSLLTRLPGSFGNSVLRHFLDSDIKAIRILSQD